MHINEVFFQFKQLINTCLCVNIFSKGDDILKRVVSLILCVCISLCTLCFSAFGAYEFVPVDCVISGMYDFSIEQKNIIIGQSSRYYYPKDYNYSIAYSAYDLLDNVQKKIYDAVVSNPGVRTVHLDFEHGELSLEDYQGGTYLRAVMDAICIDRPDIFYYAGFSTANTYVYSDHEYIYSFDYISAWYNDATYTAELLPGYYNALMKKIPQIPVNLSNRYNFIKSLHDYLCDSVYYPDLNSVDYVANAHDAYGALIEGRAVCQGYSDAIKLVCDYYKIPCVCISGTASGGGHMWNAVQMDDGKWYFIDATWNDQGDYGTFYDFFLVGSQTTNTYFGGNKFGEEHINDADLLLPLLNYSQAAYTQRNHNTGFDATHNSYADNTGKLLYLSVFDAKKSNIYYNGMYVSVDDYSTGTSFNANNEIWDMVLLGDIDYDGECNVNDYSAAVNEFLTFKGEFTDLSARACDINLDGVIDVLDVSALALMSSGLNTDLSLE